MKLDNDTGSQLPDARKVGILRVTGLPADAVAVGQLTLELASQTFGEQLKSLVGMGSLGYGGYRPGWSDYDIDIIVDDRVQVDARTLERIAKEHIEAPVHAAGHTRADIRAYSIKQLNDREVPFQNGIASRQIMLLDSATILWGESCKEQVIRPSQAQIRLESGNTARWLENLLRDKEESLPLDDIAAHFALCGRLLYTARTGNVAGKVLAITEVLDHYRDTIPADVIPWLSWAFAVRERDCFRIDRKDLRDAATEGLRRLTAWTARELGAL